MVVQDSASMSTAAAVSVGRIVHYGGWMELTAGIEAVSFLSKNRKTNIILLLRVQNFCPYKQLI